MPARVGETEKPPLPGKTLQSYTDLEIYQMFYCQNKGHICFLKKRDIYTLYKFTIAYKVFFYTQMYTFLHKLYINTFEITK